MSGRSLWRAEGRSLDEKGWVPLRYWGMWSFGLAVAVLLFYVILTPIWIGLRVLAWTRRVQGAPAALRNAVTSAGVRSRATRYARELRRIAPPPRAVHPQRVRDQRVATPHGAAQRLLVAVPELLVAAQAANGAAGEAGQPHVHRQIEPDDDVGLPEHEVADLVPVAAVDHPALAGDHGLEEGAQLVVGQLAPAGAVHERIELDERHAELPGELPADGRLPVSRRRGDDRNALHRGCGGHRALVTDGAVFQPAGACARIARMRYVYDYDEDAPGGRELLGGKGVGLAEMTALGVPVPAGFTITTDACRAYMATGKTVPEGLDDEVGRAHRGAGADGGEAVRRSRPIRCSSRCAPVPRSRCRG